MPTGTKPLESASFSIGVFVFSMRVAHRFEHFSWA